MLRKTTTAMTLVSLALATPLGAATDGSNSATNTSGASNASQQAGDKSLLCSTGFIASDTDGDGMITREEYDSALSKSFGALDADGDGDVTLEEYKGCMTETASADQSGTTTQADTSDQADASDTSGRDPQDLFPQLADADTDQSGGVDAREYMGATYDAAQNVRAGDDPNAIFVLRRFVLVPASMSDETVSGMSDEETAARASQRFQSYDRDQSGEISDQEWRTTSSMENDLDTVLNMNFDAMDEDSSGSISQAEYNRRGAKDWDAAQNAMRAQGMMGESGQTDGATEQVAGAGAEASTPEADGTRGSGGESTPPVVYFRYFAPLDAG